VVSKVYAPLISLQVNLRYQCESLISFYLRRPIRGMGESRVSGKNGAGWDLPIPAANEGDPSGGMEEVVGSMLHLRSLRALGE
jgi:hypothetical protein